MQIPDLQSQDRMIKKINNDPFSEEIFFEEEKKVPNAQMNDRSSAKLMAKPNEKIEEAIPISVKGDKDKKSNKFYKGSD